jgi:hypothetical protein
MKTLVLVNTLSSVNPYIYSNHCAFWAKTKEQFPKDEFFFFTPPRMSIDMARNHAAKAALANECDYLLFIDDDVLILPETFKSLHEVASSGYDSVGGLVIIRGYPFHVMAFKRENGELPYFDDLPTVWGDKVYPLLKDPVTQDDGLVAMGFSCTLIKTSLLRRVSPPYFVTGPRNTEDVYFYLKAKEAYPDMRLALVTHLQCGHLLPPEPIEWKTIDIFKEFYENMHPELAKKLNESSNSERDLEYIKRNTEAL